MKNKFLKSLHRFEKNRKRKFLMWLSEILLDFEDRARETKMRNHILRKYFKVKIGSGTIIDSNLSVEDNVVIGNNCLIRQNYQLGSDTIIEDNVTLSPGVRIITSGHDPRTMAYVHKSVKINKGSWIATNAIILHGAEIGEGACVAAGAVVSGEMKVPPYTIVGGVPARIIKKMTI